MLSSQNLSYWGWAWNPHQIPDCTTCTRDDVFVAIQGVVTEIEGAPLPVDDREQAARRILQLWRERRGEMVHRINGSFSLFVHEQTSDSIHLYTDRFASRSICVCREESGWIIGDTPSVLTFLRQTARELDLAGLWSYLHLGRRVANRTLFQGIHHLLAGQGLVVSKEGNGATFDWYQRCYQPDHRIPLREWGNRLASALEDSASRYRAICRRPTLFLSGGLDSRIAASALREGTHTVTLCTAPNAESRIASKVAEALGLEHETIIRSPYWYLDTTQAATWISAGSHLNHHCHFLAPVGMITAKQPEAEFFLGDLLENFNKHYFQFPDGLHPSFDADFVSDELSKYIPSTVKDSTRVGLYLQPGVRERAREAYREAVREHIARVREVSSDPLDCFNELLRWTDVTSTYTFNMITCIRAIAPERNIRLDNNLDELSLSIPSSIRGAGQLHQWTLQSLSPALRWIPDSNYFVPPVFPLWMKRPLRAVRPVLGRIRRSIKRLQSPSLVLSTSGSWLLLHEMYRRDERYRAHVISVIRNARNILGEYIDFTKVDLAWTEFEAGNVGRQFEIECLFSLSQLMLALESPGVGLP